MNSKIVHINVKFPENLKLKARLKRGDIPVIAERSGKSKRTVGDMVNGYRRITDDVAREIIIIITERQEITEKINKIINQE